MILAIFVLAIVLLASGVVGLVSAINLVPTDLGFTYFQASVTLLAAGAVILALGLAVRVIDRSLSRLSAPAAVRAAPMAPLVEPLAPAPGQEARGRMAAGGLAIGTAAGAAAGLTAASAIESISPEFAARSDGQAAGVPDKRLEEFERDLFAELESRPAPPSAMPGAMAALSAASPSVPASIGADVTNSIPELSLPKADVAAPFWADVGKASREETAGAAVEAIPAAPETPQADSAPDVPAPAVLPGLIDDADLAAVSDDSLPSLAPVSTLDVVGSYDSGGTRFTMYSDGSVIAAGPQGESRFRSLEELRRHLDAGTA